MVAVYSNLGLTYVSCASLRTVGVGDRGGRFISPWVLGESAVMASI